MKLHLWDVICIAVLCVVLTLGLWPFHSPKNEVAWLGNRDGLRFGKAGTVISSDAIGMAAADSLTGAGVEVWLQPRRIWDQCTFLTFYDPGNAAQFSLRQSEAGLELQDERGAGSQPAKRASLYIKNTFRRSGPIFLTITSGVDGTAVYADGVLSEAAPQFRFSAAELTGRLVLGDSVGQADSWSGQALGLAIYHRRLTANQVLRHYRTWTQGGRPEISADERNVALYLFDERAGNVVHDRAGSGGNLHIPERYVVLDQIFLEPFWKEFDMSWSYARAAIKNVVGFIPFGFCFFACLSVRKVRRAALATVILGSLVSLIIETLQAYLPTRDSGMTDLFTNTLGAYIGALACRSVSPILAARFPSMSLAVSPRS